MEPNNIPAVLRDRPQWVARGVDKKPYGAPGRLASSTDRATWLSFAAAVALATREGLPGVGFVFAPDDPFCGIDLDKCRDADAGTVQPWAQRLIERLNSYTEVSPSGTGLHVFVRAVLPGPGRKRSGPDGTGAIETYDRARYFTVTGLHVAGTPVTVEDRTAIIADLYGRLSDGAPNAPAPKPVASGLTPEDHALLEEIAASKEGAAFHRLFIAGETRGNHTGSENDLELAAILAKYAGGDIVRIERLMRESAIRREKWDRRGDDYLVRTIRVACRRAGTHAVATAGPPTPLSRSLAEILKDPTALEPPEAIIPGIAWRNRLTVFAAPDKAGKSTLMAAATAALRDGGRFLGEACRASTVLWVMLEEHVSDLAIRATRFETNAERLHVMEHPRSPIDAVRRCAKDLRPDVIIVDTLIRYAGDLVTEGGSSAQWTSVMVELQNLARELDSAVVVLHHTRKSDGQARDSGEITARADVVLEQMERHGEGGVMRIVVRGRWAMPNLTLKAEIDEHGAVLSYERVNEGEAEALEQEDLLIRICALLDQKGIRDKDAALFASTFDDLLHTKNGGTKAALDLGVRRGRLELLQKGNKKQYWLAQAPTASTDLPF